MIVTPYGLCGSKYGGAYGYGAIYCIQNGYEDILYSFTGDDGRGPNPLVMDASGNLYGTTMAGGQYYTGTVFMLSPSPGGWTFHLLCTLHDEIGWSGPGSGLAMDAAGNNFYGTTLQGGPYHYGSLFVLTRSGNSWACNSLGYWSGGKNGGGSPSAVTLDSNGNLYGTVYGGAYGGGVVWKITP